MDYKSATDMARQRVREIESHMDAIRERLEQYKENDRFLDWADVGTLAATAGMVKDAGDFFLGGTE